MEQLLTASVERDVDTRKPGCDNERRSAFYLDSSQACIKKNAPPPGSLDQGLSTTSVTVASDSSSNHSFETSHSMSSATAPALVTTVASSSCSPSSDRTTLVSEISSHGSSSTAGVPLYADGIVSPSLAQPSAISVRAVPSLDSGSVGGPSSLVVNTTHPQFPCSLRFTEPGSGGWNEAEAALPVEAADAHPLAVAGHGGPASLQIIPSQHLPGVKDDHESCDNGSQQQLNSCVESHGVRTATSLPSSSLDDLHTGSSHDCLGESTSGVRGTDRTLGHSLHHTSANCIAPQNSALTMHDTATSMPQQFSHVRLMGDAAADTESPYDDAPAAGTIFHSDFCRGSSSGTSAHISAADTLPYSHTLHSGGHSFSVNPHQVHHHPDEPQQPQHAHISTAPHRQHHLLHHGSASGTGMLPSPSDGYDSHPNDMRQPTVGSDATMALSNGNYSLHPGASLTASTVAAAAAYYYGDYSSAAGYQHSSPSVASSDATLPGTRAAVPSNAHEVSNNVRVATLPSTAPSRVAPRHHSRSAPPSMQRTIQQPLGNAGNSSFNTSNVSTSSVPNCHAGSHSLSSDAGALRTTTASVPVKRPRGRPRKHPLPCVAATASAKPSQEEDDDTGDLTDACNESLPRGEGPAPAPVLRTASSTSSSSRTFVGPGQPAELDGKSEPSCSLLQHRAVRCIQSLRSLQAAYYAQAAQELDNIPSQDEVAEEYLALGGPFTAIALALEIQQHHASLLEKSEREQTASEAAALVIQRYLNQRQQFAVNLNASFVWTSLDPKVPVRDLAVSRYHMAALLNDSRVFVYRHRTHPLVRSRVNQWEHIAVLDNRGVVAVRITSANLPEDWRERYHQTKRLSLIKQIRQKLRSRNIPLPPPDPFNPDDITPEELHLFVQHHPSGILCSPTDALDPDWLPEPFVLAALDRAGVVRIAKCFGFFNYPMVVVQSPAPEAQNPTSAPFPLQMPNGTAEMPRLCSGPTAPVQFHLGHPASALSDDATLPRGSFERSSVRIQRHLVCVDRVEKQPQLSIPLKELNAAGQPIKIRAQIQDVALAELTERSLLTSSGSSPEVAMVLYALGNNEHSAFVKGKNLYIRFKNFPTGPTKIYCGPLGHSGAVLLANGTVWTWTAQAKAPGSSNGKLGVLISQVGGSLEGKIVLDLMAIGADFLALTTDGVVHEWNCYAPYVTSAGEDPAVTIPQSLGRPSIPEPIELTPDFQKKLLSRRTSRGTVYKVGCFSWFGHGESTAVTNGRPCAEQKTVPSHTPRTLSPYLPASDPSEDATADGSKHFPPSIIKEHRDENDASLLGNCKAAGACSPTTEFAEKKGLEHPAAKTHLLETFLPPPLSTDPYSFLLPSSAGLPSSLVRPEGSTTVSPPLEEEVDEDGWKESDYTSEAALEAHRVSEIQRRYLSVMDPATGAPDPIERIFLIEGATLFLRSTSAQFSYILNDLACYRSGSHRRWREFYETTGGKHFHQQHAECFLRTFGDLGKPLITNPVVIARMKLPSSEDLQDDQLREQLELMAAGTPPPYRLLLSPISLLVSILRHYDFVAEARRKITLSLPVPAAAYDPRLYLEAFSGIRFGALELSNATKALALPHCSAPVEETPSAGGGAFGGDSSDSTGPSTIPAAAVDTRTVVLPRRGRGRVGRPRGSRAGLRAVLSHRRQPKSPTQKQDSAFFDQQSSSFIASHRVAQNDHTLSVVKQPEHHLRHPLESGAQYRPETSTSPLEQDDAVSASGQQPVPTTQITTISLSEAADMRNASVPTTRKRTRRSSTAPKGTEQYYTTFVDGEDSDRTWEHILQMLDEENENNQASDHRDHDGDDDLDTEAETKRRRRRGRAARQRSRRTVPDSSFTDVSSAAPPPGGTDEACGGEVHPLVHAPSPFVGQQASVDPSTREKLFIASHSYDAPPVEIASERRESMPVIGSTYDAVVHNPHQHSFSIHGHPCTHVLSGSLGPSSSTPSIMFPGSSLNASLEALLPSIKDRNSGTQEPAESFTSQIR